MKSYAVIFDLNGTLVDSETAYFQAYKEVLNDYDIPFTLELFTDYFSTRGKKLKDYLEDIGREDILEKLEDITRKKEEIFQNTIAERVAMMNGVKDILDRLTIEQIMLGLDSSTSRENIDRMLTHHELRDYFDAIASGDMDLHEKYGDVKKKSSRLLFLAESLRFDPVRCIVIGDAEKDLKGAKDIGMKAIAVPNVYTKNNDFSLADATFESLEELDKKIMEKIIED